MTWGPEAEAWGAAQRGSGRLQATCVQQIAAVGDGMTTVVLLCEFMRRACVCVYDVLMTYRYEYLTGQR